tara:strand:- start:71 stop:358 length:288 start_codon:yes stop_codon:yes gene_type:complete
MNKGWFPNSTGRDAPIVSRFGYEYSSQAIALIGNKKYVPNFQYLRRNLKINVPNNNNIKLNDLSTINQLRQNAPHKSDKLGLNWGKTSYKYHYNY